jgi:hypothetical protein
MKTYSIRGGKVKIDFNKIEKVENFVYICNKISADEDSNNDVDNRISKARSVFVNLRKNFEFSKQMELLFFIMEQSLGKKQKTVYINLTPFRQNIYAEP